MRGSLLAVLLALLAPMAAGQAERDACSEPPCGYILPILDIVVEDKLACGGGQIIFATEPPEDCYPVLREGESRTYAAKLVWKWELSEDGTYPKEVGQDILIGFSGTGTNVAWITVEVTGDDMVDGHFVIDDVALTHPDNLRRMTNAQGQESVWFWYERDIAITFTRSGGPTAEDLSRMEGRQGVLGYFVKGQSSDSGPRFKEGFGIEEFRFTGCTDPALAARMEPCPTVMTGDAPDQDTPGLPAFVLLGVLLALVRMRRSSGR